MTDRDYMAMPFDVLFSMVFTDSGEVKLCGRETCRALIKRLPEGCGNAKTGQLNVQAAYKAGKSLLGLE